MFTVYLQSLWLGFQAGGYVAEVVATHFPWVIGRHPDCDQPIPDRHLSRRHCVLLLEDGQVRVQDLGSRNGTFLNGSPVTQASPLRDGDWLELAGLPFQVRITEKPGAAGRPVAAPGQALRALAGVRARCLRWGPSRQRPPGRTKPTFPVQEMLNASANNS
jgi:predicted component of type VI protein secretion system